MNDAQIRALIAAIVWPSIGSLREAEVIADELLINAYAKLAGPQAPTTSHKEKNP